MFPLKRTPIENPHKRARIRRAETEVKRGEKLDHQYIFGGGRICGYPPCALGSGHYGDCSWWQGHLINVMGVKLPLAAQGLSTYSLAELPEMAPAIFAKGHGKLYTMYIKNIPGDPSESHTFGELRGRFTECGGSDNRYGDGRPSWFHPGEKMGLTLKERLDEFPIRVHIRGL